jgi:hypothetical protein
MPKNETQSKMPKKTGNVLKKLEDAEKTRNMLKKTEKC